MSDVWGNGGSSRDNWDDLDNGDGVGGADYLEEADISDIESAARAAFHSPSTDGVLGTAPVAVPATRPALAAGRTLTGMGNAGRGRPRKSASVGDGLPTPNGTGPRNGAGGDKAAVSRLSEPVTRGDGLSGAGVRGPVGGPTVPSGGVPRVVPRKSRAKSPDSIEVEDRVGTRNTARGYKVPDFTTASIRASVKDLKFTSNGDMEIRLVIPFECRAEGTKFADAYGVEIDVVATRVNYGNP